MRCRDLLELALSALWQQKLRVLLTMLGVILSGFVLTASLSVTQGIQETLARQYQRLGILRKIDIYAQPPAGTSEPPPEKLKVSGSMSAGRRERLQQEITRRWQTQHVASAPVRLTRERLDKIAALEHVQSIKPILPQSGRIFLRGKTHPAAILAALPEDEFLSRQMVAGEFFPRADSRSVVISEWRLYEMGIRDEAEVQKVLGQKLRLEFHFNESSPAYVVSLLGGNYPTELTTSQEKILEKVLKKLPKALDKILAPEEKTTLRQLLKPAPERKEIVITEELTICGVFRSVDDKAFSLPHGWLYRHVDVVLPTRVAEELYFRYPQNEESGLGRVIVEVDDVNEVKEVTQQIKDLGLGSYSMIEVIERERLMFLMIFLAMTAIAVVALLVASLGIANTMLMSVLERVREIGIMKAVGARDVHIQMIFLVEGGLLGLTGGVLGILLGWAVSLPADAWVRAIVEQKMHIKLEESIFVFPLWLVLGVPVFATALTTLAALLPSRRAARIKPVLALRHE